MNQTLTEEIAYHILANLGVFPSNFVDMGNTQVLLDKQFILPEKLSFELEDGSVLKKNLYGAQVAVTDKKNLKILVADCTQEKDLPEFCIVTKLDDAPAFGVYLVYNKGMDPPLPDAEAMIAVNSDGKHWMPCTMYLQATFLAGMEQLRDIALGWKKCSNYKELHSQLLLLINFHDNYFKEEDEGQEV